MKCPKIEVEVPENTTILTQDMPCVYKINGTIHNGFIDSYTRILKENSYRIIPNKLFPAMYKLDNNFWYCTNGGSWNVCDPPEKLTSNYNNIASKLENNKNYSLGSRFNIEPIVEQDEIGSKHLKRLIRKVNKGNQDEVLDALNINGINEKLDSPENNTDRIKLYTFIFLSLIAVFILYSLIINFMKYRKAPKKFKNMKYFLKGMCLPTHLEEHISRKRHQYTHDKIIEINSKLKVPLKFSKEHTDNI